MAAGRILLGAVAACAVLSCSHGAASSSPAPASPAPRPATASNQATPAQEVVTLAPRRPPPSRDSLEKLRAVYVAQIMSQIAGRENEPGRASVQEHSSAQGHHGSGAGHEDGKGIRDAAELELHQLPPSRSAGELGQRHVERQTPRALHAADDERHQPRPAAQALPEGHAEGDLRDVPSRLQRAAAARILCFPSAANPVDCPCLPPRGQSGPPPAARPPGI